jgi:hypothetical protein
MIPEPDNDRPEGVIVWLFSVLYGFAVGVIVGWVIWGKC